MASGGRRPAVLLLALSVGIGPLLLTSGTAGAVDGARTGIPEASGGSVPSLRAQAATIAGEIAAGAATVHQLSLEYLADQASAQVLSATLAHTETALSAAAAADDAAQAKLSQATVAEYVSQGSDSGLSLVAPGSNDDGSAGQTYLAAASDQFQEDEIAYKAAGERLATQVSAERQQQANLATTLSAVSKARSAALVELAHERALLAGVRGQLAQLVAAQIAAHIAAQAAAARAAAMAAQREQAAAAAAAAATAAAAASHSDSGTGPVPGSASGSPAPSAGSSGGGGGVAGESASLRADFASLRMCESGGNYAENTGNGYYGAYQFAETTWEGLGYSGLPSAAPAAEQDAAAYHLWQQSGWSPWPACSAMLGL